MATYTPPKRATAWRGYISLVSQANTKTMQANPTLALGDVKVSKDGGAFANLTTLPAVTPAGGVAVQVDLSGTEMTADNVFVQFIDAAGAEWCDLTFTLQTTARQIDDLAFPATSGRSMVVDANGLVDANTVKVGPSGSGTAQTAGDIPARLPAALTAGGNMKSDALAWNGLTTVALPLVPTVAGRSLDVSAGGEAGLDWANIGSPTTANNLSGTSTKAVEPTVAGRTLDVSAGGEAGVDWANVGSPTTAVGLTNTTISTTQVVASVSGAVASVTALAANSVNASALATDAVNEIADGFLDRDMSIGTDSGSPTVRTPRQALRFLRNKWDITAGTLTVTKENDATTSWTGAVTQTAGNPVSQIDPAG